MAALVIKELKQLRRDVRTLAMVIGMPIIVMVLFGWGYGGGMGHIPIAVANLD
ncbi:MAG: ABC transporter permease, partial [Thermoprotei archaeon]